MDRRVFVQGSAAFAAVGLIGIPSVLAASSSLHVPPEEDRHEATLMQWPVNREVHPDSEFLAILQQTIADIANSIVEFESVIMLAAKQDHARARKYLAGKVKLWDVPTEDLWCRDSGPSIAKNAAGKRVVSHLQFNGWGAKQVHKRDSLVAKKVAEHLGFPIVDSGLKGEAGGVEHDGHGLLVAHESSWVNKNRNPGQSKAQIEARLLAAYGAEKMIWSPGVWGQDITDYHIDSLARFTGPGRMLINLPDKPDLEDAFHMAALETHDLLEAAGLDIEVIPEPHYRRVKSVDFVASYANYFVCNGGVVAAQFGDKETDQIAIDALKKHYPDREIITLNVDALGEVGGGIHCATQQLPVA